MKPDLRPIIFRHGSYDSLINVIIIYFLKSEHAGIGINMRRKQLKGKIKIEETIKV
jgi:hypothetical protein